MAATTDHSLTVLLWNYHDDDVPAPETPLRLRVAGLPAAARHVLVRHYAIDHDHSNAYSVWQSMGSPQNPTPEQYSKLKAAGQLELLESPRWLRTDGTVELNFPLPRQSVSLVELSW